MTQRNWEKVRMQSLKRKRGVESAFCPDGGADAPRAIADVRRYSASAAAEKDRSCKKTYQKILKKIRGRDLPLGRKHLLLHEVIRCELLGIEMPEIPEGLRLDIEPGKKRAADLLQWARVQPKYEKFRRKKARKLGIEISELTAKSSDAGAHSRRAGTSGKEAPTAPTDGNGGARKAT